MCAQKQTRPYSVMQQSILNQRHNRTKESPVPLIHILFVMHCHQKKCVASLLGYHCCWIFKGKFKLLLPPSWCMQARSLKPLISFFILFYILQNDTYLLLQAACTNLKKFMFVLKHGEPYSDPREIQGDIHLLGNLTHLALHSSSKIEVSMCKRVTCIVYL